MQNVKNKDVEIGKKLQQIRKKKGLLQKSVATQIGMKPYTLQSIETGKRKVSFEELEKICDFYDISVEEIVRDTTTQRTDKIFINAFKSLPLEAQKDVLEYIEFKQIKN